MAFTMTNNNLDRRWASKPMSCHKCGYGIHKEFYVTIGKLFFHERCVPEDMFAYYREHEKKTNVPYP